MFMHPGMMHRPLPLHQHPMFPANVGAVAERPELYNNPSIGPQSGLQQTGPPMSMLMPMDPRMAAMSGGGMPGYGMMGPYGGYGMPGMGMGMGMGGMGGMGGLPGMGGMGYGMPGGGMMGAPGMQQGGPEFIDPNRKPTVRFGEVQQDIHRQPGAILSRSSSSTPAQTAGVNPYGLAAQQSMGPSYSSHSSGNPLAYANAGYPQGYATQGNPTTPGWGTGYDARSDPFAAQASAMDEPQGGHTRGAMVGGKRSWYAQGR